MQRSSAAFFLADVLRRRIMEALDILAELYTERAILHISVTLVTVIGNRS